MSMDMALVPLTATDTRNKSYLCGAVTQCGLRLTGLFCDDGDSFLGVRIQFYESVNESVNIAFRLSAMWVKRTSKNAVR